VGTHCALRRQMPTLLMASAMTCSSEASRAPRLSVPPSAARSLSTTASVTSSFACGERMSEMSVANRLFCPRQKRKEKRKKDTTAGDTEHLEITIGQQRSRGLAVMIHRAHQGIHLLSLGRVATHRVHRRGELRAHLLGGTVRFLPA